MSNDEKLNGGDGFSLTDEEAGLHGKALSAAAYRLTDWEDMAEIDPSIEFQEAEEYMVREDPDGKLPPDEIARKYILHLRSIKEQEQAIKDMLAEAEVIYGDNPDFYDRIHFSMVQDRPLFWDGRMRTVGEVVVSREFKVVGVWDNDDPILEKRDRTGKIELRGMDGYEWLDQPELETWLTAHFSLSLLEDIEDIQHVPAGYVLSNLLDRGETYITPGTGVGHVRVYEHGEVVSGSVDKEFSLAHEIGHILYKKLTDEQRSEWNSSFENNTDLFANTKRMLGEESAFEVLQKEGFCNFVANVVIQGQENLHVKYGDCLLVVKDHVR